MEYYVRDVLCRTTNDRFELHKNATIKLLFHRFNNFWQSFSLSKFQQRQSQVLEDDYPLEALQNKNWTYFIKTLLEVSTNQVGVSSFSNPNELSIISQTSENLRIWKEFCNSIYDNTAGYFQE